MEVKDRDTKIASLLNGGFENYLLESKCEDKSEEKKEKKTIATKVQKDEGEKEVEVDAKKIIAIAEKLVKLGEKLENEVLVKAAEKILELCGAEKEEDEE